MALDKADLPRSCVLRRHLKHLPVRSADQPKHVMIVLNTDYKEAMDSILTKLKRTDIEVMTEYTAKYSGHGGFLTSDVPSL